MAVSEEVQAARIGKAQSTFIGLCLAPPVLGDLLGLVVLASLMGMTFTKSERMLGDMAILLGLATLFFVSLGLVVPYGGAGLFIAGIFRFFLGTKVFNWFVRRVEGPVQA